MNAESTSCTAWVVYTAIPTILRVNKSMLVAMYTSFPWNERWVKSAVQMWFGCVGYVVMSRFGYMTLIFLVFFHFNPLRLYALMPNKFMTRFTGFRFICK